MPDTWNPTQYDKFQREREQPFFDLLAMVRPAARMRVVDLGCGTGRPTRTLHERLGARETIGIDRSPNMLQAQAGERALPGLRFEVGSIESFPGDRGRFDLIFSNAAYHWVADHPALLSRLAAALNPGGQLAFQVPASHDQPSHVIAEELTTVEPYKSAFKGWHRDQPVLAPEEYARILFELGFDQPQVRLVVYPHVLAGAADVVEWMKGTLLTEYQRHLPAELFPRFVEDYGRRLLARLPDHRPFFFPFKRILCCGLADNAKGAERTM
jgi:trans-aconitate 2-methyltransferase